VINALSALKYNGVINPLNYYELFAKKLKVKKFQKYYYRWSEDLEEEYFKNGVLDDFVKPNLFNFYRLYSFFAIAVSIVFLIFDAIYSDPLLLPLIVLVGVMGIAILFFPEKNLPIWNSHGLKLKDDLRRFMDYLESSILNDDSSNSKELILKNNIYLAYSTALGLSKELKIKESIKENSKILILNEFNDYGGDDVLEHFIHQGLMADGEFTPKSTNNSGDFVPGYGF
jgi:hypothetical protein